MNSTELTHDERDLKAQDRNAHLQSQRLGANPNCADPDHPGCRDCDGSRCSECGADMDDEQEHCTNAECASNSHLMPDDAEITISTIGTVDDGIDGSDQYILLTRKDDDMTPAQAEHWLLARHYRACRGPGSFYCTEVHAVQAKYLTNVCICTVLNRYDV
jgi:hypothetical protein